MAENAQQILTVASWNIHFDDRPGALSAPQYNRLPHIKNVLAKVKPDVCGFSEVEGDGSDNPGARVAERLGYEYAYFAPYGRPREILLLTSRLRPSHTETIPLDANREKRKAVAIKIGDVTIIGTHLSSGVHNVRRRTRELSSLLEHYAHLDNVIIMGDFDTRWFEKSRRMLNDNGFQSVAEQLPPRRSIAAQDALRNLYSNDWQDRFQPNNLAIDDIYVKGLTFTTGGLLEGESDHFGVWATLTTHS